MWHPATNFEYGLLMSANYGFIALLMFERTEPPVKLTYRSFFDPRHFEGNFVEAIDAQLKGRIFERTERVFTEMCLEHIEEKPLLDGRFTDTEVFPNLKLLSNRFQHPLEMLVTDAKDIFFPDLESTVKRLPDWQERLAESSYEMVLRHALNAEVMNVLINRARCAHLLRERARHLGAIIRINTELKERNEKLPGE